MEDIIKQLLSNVESTVEKIDIINKRLINCIFVLCVSFFLCIGTIVGFYFLADYDYIDANQNIVTDTNTTNQSFKTGGE